MHTDVLYPFNSNALAFDSQNLAFPTVIGMLFIALLNNTHREKKGFSAANISEIDSLNRDETSPPHPSQHVETRSAKWSIYTDLFMLQYRYIVLSQVPGI